jgi:hypothetical protein
MYIFYHYLHLCAENIFLAGYEHSDDEDQEDQPGPSGPQKPPFGVPPVLLPPASVPPPQNPGGIQFNVYNFLCQTGGNTSSLFQVRAVHEIDKRLPDFSGASCDKSQNSSY